ncbi:MAG: hypothetical protein B6D72_08280 [gamma proteobacterium symbiont of Ctena orbiculata]|uniref:PNPLA domain-containing protein n=1 Tax=Candidatus Thiodiazotropha taylori TaxID=2792791 RepID=A0A944M864_9GAMM|nr:hypothetical protein [Candidatus Thiodiazotropha taylori]PUB87195.1 MAG: hypothetical protein DBP00_09315 [gamma proteobacterium symbiont of Ctena orbiculata]MBT2989196.1 hypothetical protein [Candidatus Thiodiazotropha taylori]MBT2995593.1 hypothetical protein [Candidatus Thiodiazotropha taylori]MBT2999453.1 hypothetical protein [Candidatus Thiodiazotropha taylori]
MQAENKTILSRRLIALWILFFIALMLTGALAGWLSAIDYDLAQVRGDGIVSLELAWKPDRAQEILTSWLSADLIPKAKSSVYWDFLLIVGYVTLLTSMVLLAWAPLVRSRQHRMPLLLISGVLPLLAGCCDIVENVLMLSMLSDEDGVGTLRPPLTSGFAYTKFALLALFFALAVYFARPVAKTIFRVRFSLLMLAIGVAVLFVPQWQEMLRAITETVGQADDGLTSTQLLRAAWLAFASLLAAFSTWYSARVLFMFRFDGYRSQDEDPMVELKRWLPRVLGTAIPLLVAVGYFVSVPTDRFGETLIPAVFQSVALLIFLGIVVFRRKLIPSLRDKQMINTADGFSGLETYTKYPLGGLLIANVVFFLLFLYLPEFAVPVGGAAVVVLAVALIVPIGSLLVYYSTRLRYPLLIVLAVLVMSFSLFNDNHSIRLCPDMASTDRECHDDNGVPIGIERAGPFHQVDGFTAFMERWVSERKKDNGDPLPVFIVAAEGGGIRAAYWTAHVLATLQDRARAEGLDFARHLLAISGVSGGSLGGAVFAASVKHLDDTCTDQPNCFGDLAHDVLGEDFLSPTVATLLFPDLMQRFLPSPLFADRAMTLERSWEQAWNRFTSREDFAMGFDHLWKDRSNQEKPHPPVLLLNSTVVETGQRLIMTPLELQPNGIEFGEVFRDAIDGRSLLGNAIPLSTAVHLSARFTYVSPAGKVFRSGEGGREAGWLHLVDGGYFENSGAVTAFEMLDAMMRYARSTDNELRPFVIHISNEPVIPDKERARKQVSFYPLMGEVLSPLRALLKVRPARGFQAREFLQRRLDEELLDSVNHVHFLLCKRDHDLPLGWALSEAVQVELAAQLSAKNPHGVGAPAYNFANMHQVLQHLGTGEVQGDSSAEREAALISICRQ